MATSEQVAQLAGVSRATVSRALNGSARVSDEVRERVHAAIAALGYEPDVVAQSLVRQHSRVIAVSLFPEDNNLPLSHLGQTSQYFYLGVLQNIEREAVALGYDLLLPSRPHGNSPENYIRSLQTRRVAGAIILHATDSRIQALIHAAIPTVFIDRKGQGGHATYVKSDNMDGARRATEHLLSLGHRHIAFLTGQTVDLAGMERLLGCQQALAYAGVAPDPGLVRQSGWNIDDAYEAARALLAERRDFTAIVAGSDLMAMGILRALTEHGLRVPDDVSLVGFDDVEFSQYTNPPLTTVRQDRVEMVRAAVHRLIAMIEGTGEASPLIIPTQLIVRKSTGPVPKDIH
ncbi:MAG: LacI family transcriptional regulator [Ktedonobacter sp. 13_1_20CM_4_53_11]|jgi:LacI family transcriptional regulator|nr:MAG: LacI family transcriptional regulator [Ktedonobacter sp. 13_2_20CM_53_11]OLB62663.1 MAG: LacI family transcriptional regulator [Ktedonobacter sp. 13_2_20CM_2_54_8]OLE05072.1 MAG: LacI family transcriptional regulator [Ktedonobacter sp. 13_1_20CM_4_53_11]